MGTSEYPARGYLLAAVLGAIGGGLAIIIAAEMMTGRMPGMMRAMSEMGAEGCDPGEM